MEAEEGMSTSLLELPELPVMVVKLTLPVVVRPQERAAAYRSMVPTED